MIYLANNVQDIPNSKISWKNGLRPAETPEICFHLEELETGARAMFLVFYNADKKDGPCDVRMLLKVELDLVFSEVFLPGNAAISARSQCEDPDEALHRGWENILADNCTMEFRTKAGDRQIVEVLATMINGDVAAAEMKRSLFTSSLTLPT